jgi:hypothetical protein
MRELGSLLRAANDPPREVTAPGIALGLISFSGQFTIRDCFVIAINGPIPG